MSKPETTIVPSPGAAHGAPPVSNLRAFDTQRGGSVRASFPELMERMAMLRRAVRPTALAKLDIDGAEVFVKLESQGLVGSVKDRPALWVLQQAIARGEVGPTTTIIESSSGNYAMALAAYCRWLGLQFIPVIDPNIAPLNGAMLRSMCTRVEAVEERDDSGGFLKTRLRRVHQLCKDIPEAFWTNQYGNPDGALGHYYLTASEICEQVSELDYAFIGVSSGGTVAGISMRLKEHFPNVKIVAVDSVGSIIFGGAIGRRHIPGIGASIVPDLLKYAHIDEVMMVPEASAIAGCRELLSRHAVFAGGSTGSVFVAVKQLLARHRGASKPKILFLCADRGTAYLDTIYNDQWITRVQGNP